MPRKPDAPAINTTCPKRTRRGSTRAQEGRTQSDDHYADASKLKDDGERCYDTR